MDDELLELRQALEEELVSRGLSTELPSRAAPPVEEEVWISRSGSKYHSRATCSGMKSTIRLTLDEAREAGYTPCKKCEPPQ